MECEVTAVSIKKEESISFHELTYSEEEDALLVPQNKEDLNLKEESEITLSLVKKEEENDDKLVFNNINYYPDEAVYQTLLENIRECEKDPLDISNNKVKYIKQEDMFTEDFKEELKQSILEEEKHLTHGNPKCSGDIVELENECSADTNNPLCTSVNEDDIQSSTSYISDSTLLPSEKKTENLIHQDKQLGKHHVCFLCCKYFSTAGNLTKHIDAVHNRINNYECNQCYKIFFRPDDFRRHIDEVHKGIKIFECNLCHKLFFRGDKLRKHVDSAHKRIKYYKCDECGKMFSEACQLKNHINGVHKRIKNYECNQCSRSFFRTNELKRHLDGVHKGIKRYECHECDKMFLCKAYLKSHVTRIHKAI